jgi:hypothetical protein
MFKCLLLNVQMSEFHRYVFINGRQHGVESSLYLSNLKDSGLCPSSYLELRTMDKVQEPSNSEPLSVIYDHSHNSHSIWTGFLSNLQL